MECKRIVALVTVLLVLSTSLYAQCFPATADAGAYCGPVASGFEWDWGRIDSAIITLIEEDSYCRRSYQFISTCNGSAHTYQTSVSLDCCSPRLSELYVCSACYEDIRAQLQFAGYFFQYDPRQFHLTPDPNAFHLTLVRGDVVVLSTTINGPIIRSVVDHDRMEKVERWRCTNPTCSWISAVTAQPGGSSTGQFGEDLQFTVDTTSLAPGVHQCQFSVSWHPFLNGFEECTILGSPMAGKSVTVEVNVLECAQELHVDRDGGGDYTDLQSAIEDACPGSTITVAPGEYEIVKPVIFPGKDLRVTSIYGAKRTTIRMANSPEENDHASVVVFTQGMNDAVSRLEGFTISGGRGTALGQKRNGSKAATWGGGILCEQGSSAIVEKCIIEGNSAWCAPGVYCGSKSHLTLRECRICRNNQSPVRPYVEPTVDVCRDSVVTFDRCFISGNRAAGVDCSFADVTFTNCLIAGNHLRGVYLPGSVATLKHCTITETSQNTGLSLGSTVTIANCIVWGNGRPFSRDDTDNAGWNVSHSCIEVADGLVWPGDGNINQDPLFVQAGHWNDNGTPDDASDDVWIEGDYHLLPASPCVDSGRALGAPTTDIEGNGRPCGASVDMGAYEMIGCPPTPFQRGDSNSDSSLDIADAIFTLSYLFAQGPSPSCLDAADANDDGAVDLADGIFILQSLFAIGPAIPPPYPGCGVDPTVDELDCLEYRPCE